MPLAADGFSENTRRAFARDVRSFAVGFGDANREPFTAARVAARHPADFRDYLRRERGKAVATADRAPVAVRRCFAGRAGQGRVALIAGRPHEGVRNPVLLWSN